MPHSIYIRNNPVFHFHGILIPKLSVFCPANLVVIGLAGQHKSYIVSRVQPHHPNPKVAGGDGYGNSLNYFSKIVDMTACAPEPISKKA